MGGGVSPDTFTANSGEGGRGGEGGGSVLYAATSCHELRHPSAVPLRR